MKRMVCFTLLALLFLQTCVSAKGTFSDAVMLQALETGRSLAFVKILAVRAEGPSQHPSYCYRATVVKLLIAGDLAPADIQGPLDLHAGASYGKALTIGTHYALFITMDTPSYFSWAHRDNVIAVDPSDAQTRKQIETQAQRIYRTAPIRHFRETQPTEKAGDIRKIPAKVKALCAQFKRHQGNRCELAKAIWATDLGSHLDTSYPHSSKERLLPPNIPLTRAQALLLLGNPTIKLGYTYQWFCGQDAKKFAGVLTLEFDPKSRVTKLTYSLYPLEEWVK